jgi:hypothetical protein
MKLFFLGLIDIIAGLWEAIADAGQEFLDLCRGRIEGDEGQLYLLIDDGEEQTSIPVSRLGEFILEEPEPSESTEAQYDIISFPLMDALDFDDAPSDADIQSLKPDDKVLLASNHEGFWVSLTEVSDGMFKGVIQGAPQKNGYRQWGEVEFASHHIFQFQNAVQSP